LYWWNVKEHGRWGDILRRIGDEGPFDLIGFQECENVGWILQNAGLSGFSYYTGPNKPSANPAPLAWNRAAFLKMDGPGYKVVAHDEFGARVMTWVRLRHLATGANVYFANTHGPLNNCDSQLGRDWSASVSDTKQPGDIAFMTGDFNCWTGTNAMNMLHSIFSHRIESNIDQILADAVPHEGTWGGRRDGWPSDHPLVKGTFTLP
jgi:hypothetical protein